MPAQVRNVAGSNSAASATLSITATMPTGFVAGDLLIGIARGAAAAAPSARPSGSTLIRNIADTAFNLDVVRKTAVGGDTFAWSAAVARKWAVTVIAVVAGTWDTGTPIDAENGLNHTAASATLYTTPSITVVTADCLLIAAFGNAAASTWTSPAQTPAMVMGATTTSTGTTPASGCLIHSALNAVPLGATTRQATASLTSAEACMWIGAVRPSSTPTIGKWVGMPPGQRRPSVATHTASTW
jgi:hypothetical protein